jgi:hypothetical protein
MFGKHTSKTSRVRLFSSAAIIGFSLLIAQLATAQTFSFNTGNADGKLGAASRPASPAKAETEAADDFLLQQTTVINQATIIGLVPAGTPLTNIKDLEVEVYNVFPLDSAIPPSGNVPSRTNSPADVEIATATRSGSSGTLKFLPSVLDANFFAANTVVNKINKAPDNPLTGGEGSFTGEEVQITITFTNPIILPAGHYFFRPEVLLTDGDFLFLSAPRSAPSFTGEAQAWIRNTNLKPDWLRIGKDIVGGTTTFNMSFSLAGEAIPNAGTPGSANCDGKTISALADQLGSTDQAASALGFSSVTALQDGFRLFCRQ